jgi:3-hydroxybutyryl-CoA dehydrogenase
MIKTIGIIGAGQMGNGIAHVAALAGMDVRLLDINEEVLKQALETIDHNMQRQVRRGMIQDPERKAATSSSRRRAKTSRSSARS